MNEKACMCRPFVSGARRARTADLLGAIQEQMGNVGDWRGLLSGFRPQNGVAIPLCAPAVLTKTHQSSGAGGSANRVLS